MPARHTLVALAVSVAVAWPAAAQRQTPSAYELVDLASEYVVRFVDTLSNVVAEERYVQQASIIARSNAGQSRELRADFLLVRASRNERWAQFRDVFELNGQRLEGRTDRLAEILSRRDDSDLERGRRMSEESSRYNIGVRRTFNLPLHAIGFLQPNEVTRFRYEVERADPLVGPDVWIVAFRETARPTVVQEAGRRDVPTRGRFWISSRTGRIWKSEWRIDFTGMTAIIRTDFATDPDFPVLVPRRMDESYTSPTFGQQLTATAQYGRFRRFSVATEESIQDR